MTDPLPLAGVRLLDLSRVLAGPLCAQVLGDLGADVIKVERPGRGDDTRQWGPPFVHGQSSYFQSVNRNKRSIALDLRQPEARVVLDDLIRQSDLLLENFLPPEIEKFGLSPERLRSLNPRLVSCSISGFGRTGPWSDRPGYDVVVQALSGLMGITGPIDGEPSKVGVAITDVVAGLYAAVCLLSGLRAQQAHSAGGASFDIALFDCTLASLVNVAQSTLATGKNPERFGNGHPTIVPYQTFACADGHLMLAVGNDAQFGRLCEVLELPEWARDPRFADNPSRVAHRRELIEPLAPIFAGRSLADWERLLSAADVPHAPVRKLGDALALPQVAAREMVVEVEQAGEPLR
ncbi:MAG TPA: CoA transferase, partial [Planctomycetaceae bacterium]|nr:CoA transferase [Planctomycetaceae bacterium]